LALVVGDASGKGLAAALLIANVQSSLRTAAYGVFDQSIRTLRYVNAGHNPPVVVRRDGSVHCLDTGGAPVGLFADSEYEEGFVKLETGDLVIAFTDGLIEVTNQDGEEWGVQGLLKAANWGAQCSQDAGDLVNSIFNSMDDFSKEHQIDDATLAVLRVI